MDRTVVDALGDATWTAPADAIATVPSLPTPTAGSLSLLASRVELADAVEKRRTPCAVLSARVEPANLASLTLTEEGSFSGLRAWHCASARGFTSDALQRYELVPSLTT